MKVAQSCPTLCDPMDSTVQGIIQARILEWVAFPFSSDLLDPGIEPRSPTMQAESLRTELSGKHLYSAGMESKFPDSKSFSLLSSSPFPMLL